MRLSTPLALFLITFTSNLFAAVAQETVADAGVAAEEETVPTVESQEPATDGDAGSDVNAAADSNAADIADDEEVISLDDEEDKEPAASDSAAATPAEDVASEGDAAATATEKEAEPEKVEEKAPEPPVQTGPFIDIFGEQLLSLQMVDETHAQLVAHYTNEALSGKKVVGLYFSADWCGPCRQFTPDLVNFYNKMNSRRGKKDEFEIVWVSRCRDVDSYGQYFTQMNWLALPPQEAMGQRGQMLSNKYKVKGIPTLVLLDEVGNVITTDGRNKIPMDKAGIGFPWRNPLAQLYITVVPKSLRLMIKSQIEGVKSQVFGVLKGATGQKAAA